MSEPELVQVPTRSRKLSTPSSEPPRSPPGLTHKVPSRAVSHSKPEPSESETTSSKVECHDLLVSDDDENWTLQMDDDDEDVTEVGSKITDFVRESFKKEGKEFGKHCKRQAMTGIGK